jgi:hypothetical protein
VLFKVLTELLALVHDGGFYNAYKDLAIGFAAERECS